MSDKERDIFLNALRKNIRRAYRARGTRRANRSSPGEELRAIVKRKRGKLREVPKDIQIWLLFFDEAISFWFAVWANYKQQISGPQQNELICLMALSGRVFQDMLCLRELILAGFSVQANVVARSLIESIDVMHLLNSRPDLANRFRCVESNDEATQFWHEYCSRNKLHKIVKERWLWFFDSNEEVASGFHSQREGYTDITGMSVHPTFAASFTTFMDSHSPAEQNIFDIVLGTISPMSKFTMHLILIRIFEYGILWTGPKLGIYKGDETRAPVDPFLYDTMSKGLGVMTSIVRTLDDDGDQSPFYPEFRTYWPRPKES